MTEQELEGIGFELVEQYSHDEFNTSRYKKGVLEVEFTYEGDKLISHDLTISELNCRPVTISEMRSLTHMLGNWKEV